MANLSNINGKFVVEQTTGFVGIGTTDPGFLIEAAGTNAELALNAGSIYRLRSTAGNEFIITKNGVGDRLTISSGGDVGIGTSTPDTLLNLEGAVNTSIITLGCTKNDASWSGERIGGINFYSADGSGPGAGIRGSINYIATSSSGGSTAMTFATGDNTEKMRIDQYGDISMTEGLSVQKQFTTGTNQSSGQTYVTIRNYDAALVDAGDIQSVLRMTGRYWSGSTSQLVESQVYSGHEIGNGNGGSFLGFATQSGGSAVVEAMRIGRGGKLHYNCTDDATSSSAGLVFYPSGDNSYIINAVDLTSSWNHLTFINTNGTVGSISTSGSATAFNTSSDYRLKEDLKEFNGLDKVSNIKVYDFKWKVDENRSYGVLAHELAEVLPQAVNGEKDAKEMQGVDYSKIVPLLVKAIQELKAEIELLKSK